jgi:predicted nucleic acid-binding protein
MIQLPKILKLYFDTCCYSRLYDIQVTSEYEAIRDIIDNRIFGEYRIIGSLAVTAELKQTPDTEKRSAIEEIFYRIVQEEDIVELSVQCLARAHELYLKGLGNMDSRHLAAAETANADFLLTTDLRFIRICNRLNLNEVKVINPIDFNRRS